MTIRPELIDELLKEYENPQDILFTTGSPLCIASPLNVRDGFLVHHQTDLFGETRSISEAEHTKRMENDLFSCYGQENKMDSYVRMKGERYGQDHVHEHASGDTSAMGGAAGTG